MRERTPAEVFPPGEVIKEELEARGWSQAELAEILGRPPRVVSEIISGKRAITPETAKGLGAAFGTGAAFWTNLEGSYQLARTVHDDASVEKRARLYGIAPVKEMIKRGWIRPSAPVAVLERQLLTFLEIDGLERESPERSIGARRAWFNRTRQIALSISAPVYSEKRLRAAVEKMKAFMVAPEGALNVPKTLMECGVKYVIVENLPQTEIDGACFWIEGHPVIGMTLRKDRMDHFWFVVRHEIEHVLLGRGKESEIIDSHLELEDGSPAADFCVPRKQLEAFLAAHQKFCPEKDVLDFARAIQRHPCLVVGQMQLRLKDHSLLAKHLARIRQFVLPDAIVDGWGHTASTLGALTSPARG
jgi:HTH-type transcriptional regulator / antitoxin HigA